MSNLKKQLKNLNPKSYNKSNEKISFISLLKLGIEIIKHQKFKSITLIIAICLFCVSSYIFYTISNCNINSLHIKLLNEKNEQFIQIEKYNKNDLIGVDNITFNNNEVLDVKNKIYKQIKPIYSVLNKSGHYYNNIYDVLHISSKFDRYSYDYGNLEIEIVEDSEFEYINRFNLIGRIPKLSNEIVISNVIADLIIKNGIDNSNSVFHPKDYNELLSNNDYYFGSCGLVKIVGIIDYDLSKYKNILNKYDESKTLNKEELTLYQEYIALFNNVYNKIFVNNDFISNIITGCEFSLDTTKEFSVISSEFEFSKNSISPSIIKDDIEYFDGKNWVTANNLEANQIILNAKQLLEFENDNYDKELSIYLEKNLNDDISKLEKEFFANYINRLNIIGKIVNLKVVDKKSGKEIELYNDLHIIGVSKVNDFEENNNYLDSSIVSKYKINPLQITGLFILENNKVELKKLMDKFPYNNMIIKSTYSYNVNNATRTLSALKSILVYILPICTLFVVIMLVCFVFSSIKYYKKEIKLEIPIPNVYTIFFCEFLIITLISNILSFVSISIITQLLNSIFMKGIDYLLTPLIISLETIIIMLVLSFFILFLMTGLLLIKKIYKN